MNYTSMGGNGDYLNYVDLVDGNQVNRICYVLDVKSSVTKMQQAFYTLFVRTTEGNVLPCFVFNTDDDTEKGFKLNALKGKYVRLNTRPQESDGSLILKYLSHEVVNATPEILQAFQKKIADVDKLLSDINSVSSLTGVMLPEYFKTIQYPEIFNGFVGGYVKFCWQVLMSISTTCPSEMKAEALKVTLNIFIHYNTYLSLKNRINIITESDKLDILLKIPSNDFTGILVRNTMSSLMGLTKPTHVISLLICSLFKQVSMINSAFSEWEVLQPGGRFVCEDYELHRY